MSPDSLDDLHLRLILVRSIPGIRKRVVVPHDCWLVLERPRRRRDSIQYWESGETVKLAPLWERLLGLDIHDRFMVIPKECRIAHWQFAIRSTDEKIFVVPISFTFRVEEPIPLFQAMLRLGKGWGKTDLIEAVMPPDETLWQMGETYYSEELDYQGVPPEEFVSEFENSLRTLDGVTCDVQLGTPAWVGSFVELQQNRQQMVQALEFRDVQHQDGRQVQDLQVADRPYGIDLAHVVPKDSLPLAQAVLSFVEKGGKQPGRRLLEALQGKASGSAYGPWEFSSFVVQGARQYAELLPGLAYPPPQREQPGIGWINFARPSLLGLHTVALLAILLLFQLEVNDFLDMASQVVLNVLTLFLELYGILTVESLIVRRHRQERPADSYIETLVQALNKKAAAHLKGEGDWIAAQAHALAARDLAKAYGLGRGEAAANRYLEAAGKKLREHHCALGKPLSASVAKHLKLHVQCVRFSGHCLEPYVEEIELGQDSILFAPPGQSTVHLGVALDSTGEPTWFAGSVVRDPFQLGLYLQPLGADIPREHQALLNVDGLDGIRRLSQDSVKLPELVDVPAPLDLAIVVDGTLASPQFSRACQITSQVLTKLKDVPGQAKLILFGDGPHGVKRKRYRPEHRTFGPQKFGRMLNELEKVLAAGPLPYQDYQRNLEVGLAQARTYLAASPHAKRAILIIGNALPHPCVGEDLRSLLRTDPYAWPSLLNWEEELMGLKDLGVKVFVLWMPNSSERSQEIWRRLASNGTWVTDDSATNPKEHPIPSSLQAFAEEGERFYQLAGPLYLPTAHQRLSGILAMET